MTTRIRLLAPLVTMAMSTAFCPRAAHAQDSPIIINDNGNVPLETQGRKAAAGKKSGGKTVVARRPGTYSATETHVHYEDLHGIQQKNGETFIEEQGYKAVCLEHVNGVKILLPTTFAWRLYTLSDGDNAVLSSDGRTNNHIHIDLGKSMYYNPPADLDDPDPSDIPNGKKNDLSGLLLSGGSALHWYTYQSLRNFRIHYCGPTGCKDGGGVDQCAGAVDPADYSSRAREAIKPKRPAK